MNINRIKSIEDSIKNNKKKLREEKGNYKNQEILKLKIKIDELKLKIERLK